MSKNKRRQRSPIAKPRSKSNLLAGSKAKKSKVKPSKAQPPKANLPGLETKKTRQRRTSDLRIRRTRSRLSNALIELMRYKLIDQITVQEVLDKAGVGRSTFYLHYRDKDDLFLDQMENGMEMWSTLLTEKQEKSNRLAPVEEFFTHAGSAMKFYRALIDSGRIHAFFDLAEGCFARGIARRLREIGPSNTMTPNLGPKNPPSTHNAGRELDARSHALAGNLMSLLKWWLDHGAKEPPTTMDQLFHGIAWKGLQAERN